MSKSMQVRLKATIATLALLSVASVSATSVSTPVNGTLIETTITNDSGTISSILFDLSNTVTMDGSHVVFGGLYGVIGFTPAGSSTYSEIGSEGDSVFGFNFGSFQAGQSFKFGWDPDSAINDLYGVVPKELVGTKVSAIVVGGPNLRGVMALDPTGNVGVMLTPVPEPETYALLLAGLGVIGMVARRRSAR